MAWPASLPQSIRTCEAPPHCHLRGRLRGQKRRDQPGMRRQGGRRGQAGQVPFMCWRNPTLNFTLNPKPQVSILPSGVDPSSLDPNPFDFGYRVSNLLLAASHNWVLGKGCYLSYHNGDL